MQTPPRVERDSDPELAARAALQAQARFWTLLAASSVFFALNLFLGIVATILAQIARRAANRGDFGAATASLRWARLLTLIGIGMFGVAAAACFAVVALQSSR